MYGAEVTSTQTVLVSGHTVHRHFTDVEYTCKTHSPSRGTTYRRLQTSLILPARKVMFVVSEAMAEVGLLVRRRVLFEFDISIHQYAHGGHAGTSERSPTHFTDALSLPSWRHGRRSHYPTHYPTPLPNPITQPPLPNPITPLPRRPRPEASARDTDRRGGPKIAPTKVARKREKHSEPSDACAGGAEAIAGAWVRFIQQKEGTRNRSHVSALHLHGSGGSDGLDHAFLRLC